MGLCISLGSTKSSIASCCGHASAAADVEQPPSPLADPDGLRRFQWPELQSATSNLSPSSIIAHGGFSTVYLTHLPSTIPAATKVYHNTACSERHRRSFLREIDALRRTRHPNIITLLGFSDDLHHSALVFSLAPHGTLHHRLHDSSTSSDGILPWAERVYIAYALADAVDYLHERCSPTIVHSDITASNVLLDASLVPKLCDFGSAETGFSAAVRSPLMVGSPGYADPHYLRTGLVSKKSDVYSYGVVLLELLTGVPAAGTEEGRLLAAEVGPALLMAAEGRVGEMVDGRLEGRYVAAEAAAMAEVATACIGDQPSLRPAMAEVVRILRESGAASIAAVGGKAGGEVAGDVQGKQ